MPDLKQAITILGIIILMLAIMLSGDYLGHKFGRVKLLTSVGFIGLAVVIAYAVYSFVVLVLFGR